MSDNPSGVKHGSVIIREIHDYSQTALSEAAELIGLEPVFNGPHRVRLAARIAARVPEFLDYGSARADAERLGVPFLGEVPLDMAIREKSDAGQPVVASAPDGALAQCYRDIAARVRDGLAGATRRAPKIVIEA